MITMTSLREAGFKVYVSHFRYLLVPHTNNVTKEVVYIPTLGIAGKKLGRAINWEVKEGILYGPGESAIAYGGATAVTITSPDGLIEITTRSTCHLSDHFVRKTGFNKALGRAIKVLCTTGHANNLK